jgi:hypothetical protein
LGRAARKVDDAAGVAFNIPDNSLKSSIWVSERNKLGWALGKSPDSDSVMVRAAENTNRITANYSRIPLWAQKLRDSPVIGPFVPWVASTFDATLATARIAGMEIAEAKRTGNAKLAMIGTHRMASLMGALTFPFVAASTGYAMAKTLNGGDQQLAEWDEESDRAMRTLLYDWQKNAVMVPTTVDSGNLVLWDGSYMNYYDVVSGTAAAVARGEDPEEAATNGALAIGRKLFSPELGVAFARDAYDSIRAEQSAGLKIYKALDLALVKYGPLRIPGRMVRAEDSNELRNTAIHAATGFRPTTINVNERVDVKTSRAKAQRLAALEDARKASLKMGMDAPAATSLAVQSAQAELAKLYGEVGSMKDAVLRFGGSQGIYAQSVAEIGPGGKALLGGAPPEEAARLDLEQWLAKQRDALLKKEDEELKIWSARYPLATPSQRVERVQQLRGWRTAMQQALTLKPQEDPWANAFQE